MSLYRTPFDECILNDLLNAALIYAKDLDSFFMRVYVRTYPAIFRPVPVRRFRSFATHSNQATQTQLPSAIIHVLRTAESYIISKTVAPHT